MMPYRPWYHNLAMKASPAALLRKTLAARQDFHKPANKAMKTPFGLCNHKGDPNYYKMATRHIIFHAAAPLYVQHRSPHVAALSVHPAVAPS